MADPFESIQSPLGYLLFLYGTNEVGEIDLNVQGFKRK